jgi:tetratricopeptide (TPR) repeat protein
MLSNFDQRADISVLKTHQIIRFTFFALLLSAVTAFSGKLMAETAAVETGVPANPCYSTDPSLGDSAYWASTAVSLYAQQNYEAAVATVDACFKYWGPKAGQAQKKLRDSDVPLPPTGRVNAEMKAKIGKDYLINDVAMALWAKSRSLHELKRNEEAKQSYAQCLYMEHGRAWDPNGWFWSPAEDCLVYARKLARK